MPLSKAQIARLRSLREKKQREALGLFIVEGETVVSELLASGGPLTEVFVTLPHLFAKEDPRVCTITREEMARISHFPTPSGALAIGTLRRDTLIPGELDRGRTLVLDGVQDAGNVGTLLRIADWFGFDRVVLSPDSADLFSQKVINASMGSFCRLRVITSDLGDLLASVAPGTAVLGCDLEGEDVHGLEPFDNVIVVIGNEGKGLSPSVAVRIRRRVTIPRYGRAESLNAAVAAGIVCAVIRHTRA